jgi:membrane-associated protease RseP (regulator of RpoE activity)
MLVYDRQINEATRATAINKARKNLAKKKFDEDGKIEEIIINEDDLADPDVMYDFYVSYWAKLPKPLFGTHLISFSENDERGSEGGLFVIAVIKESAAANAGILRQDRIMKINGIELNTPEEFIKELIKNRGQTVVIDYKRSGELKNISVQL